MATCDIGPCVGAKPSTPRQGSLAKLELGSHWTSSFCFCPELLWLRARIRLSSQEAAAEQSSPSRAKVL